jgi:hypothetical protein
MWLLAHSIHTAALRAQTQRSIEGDTELSQQGYFDDANRTTKETS